VPGLGWAFVLAAFASLGLPGLAHFPAEFQIFLGTFYVYPVAVSSFWASPSQPVCICGPSNSPSWASRRVRGAG